MTSHVVMDTMDTAAEKTRSPRLVIDGIMGLRACPFESFKVIAFDANRNRNRKRMFDFLLVINSNLNGNISHRF